jgi:membrane protein implicated in regulation of membrane protease activity
MGDWVMWLVLAGGLLVAELFTLTFVLGLLSAAAAVTAVAALLGVPLAGQIGAMAVTSGLLFVLVKPFERRQRQAPALTTGTAALAGRTAVVTEEIKATAGRVKLGGESWAARLQVPGPPVPAGSTVIVVEVDGATLVVFPEEL